MSFISGVDVSLLSGDITLHRCRRYHHITSMNMPINTAMATTIAAGTAGDKVGPPELPGDGVLVGVTAMLFTVLTEGLLDRLFDPLVWTLLVEAAADGVLVDVLVRALVCVVIETEDCVLRSTFVRDVLLTEVLTVTRDVLTDELLVVSTTRAKD